MYKEIDGDLLVLFKSNKFDIIAHGCNCQCTMGSGLALQIKEQFPEVWEKDKQTIKGDLNKLGTYNFTELTNNNKIYNLYTQFGYGTTRPHISYPAVELCIQKLFYLERTRRIGLPKIGCGLAGGDWKVVSEIIQYYENKYRVDNITIVNYKI